MQITGINRGDASETRPRFVSNLPRVYDRRTGKQQENRKRERNSSTIRSFMNRSPLSREHLFVEQFFLLISRRSVSRHSHKYYSFVLLDIAETITHRWNVTVSDKFAKFSSRYHPIEKVPRGSSRSFGDRSPLTGLMIFRGEAKDDKAEWDEGVSMSDGGICCTGLVFGDL